MKTIHFSRTEPNTVVLRVSRITILRRYLVGICSILFMITVLLCIVFRLQKDISFVNMLMISLFFASIAATAYGIVAFRKTSIAGNKFAFDLTAKNLLCNNKFAAHFEDIKKVKVEKFVDNDVCDGVSVDYIVNLTCGSKYKKIYIENFANRDEALYVANKLSNILDNIGVEKKPNDL